MRAKSGQWGFTLVELMVGVAIVGILAAVSAPGIMASIPRYQLRAEVRELVINFKKAKLEAIKRRRNVAISFTPAAGAMPGSYQIFVDNNLNGTFEAGTDDQLSVQLINQRLLLPDVDGDLDRREITFTGNRTWYEPTGLVPLVKTGRCEIQTLDGNYQYVLVLSPTGAVRVESRSNGGAWSE